MTYSHNKIQYGISYTGFYEVNWHFETHKWVLNQTDRANTNVIETMQNVLSLGLFRTDQMRDSINACYDACVTTVFPRNFKFDIGHQSAC